MPRKSSSKGPNKTKFVLSQPAGLPAKEVIARGKAVGLSLNDKYIYSIRSKHRAGKSQKRTMAAKNAAHRPASVWAGGSLEKRLLQLALELGLSKAEALLMSLRDKVKQSIT